MKFKALLLGVLAVSMVISSCNKDNERVLYALIGTASGAQEAPDPVATKAVGNLTGTYNVETNTLSYWIAWTNLSENPVAMHFHGPASPGVPAGVQVPITGFPAAKTGSVRGEVVIDEVQEAQLLSGLWYYNIHTPPHPGGEIRGQVIPQ